MATSRNIVIAGAGIGGLTAALSLAQRGFRVVVLEQAARLEEAGAGIQLSPNATRVLNALGLERRLVADAVAPQSVDICAGRGGRIARIPLGEYAARRYGSPYWVTHRADLQAALLEAAKASPDIVLNLGTRVDDFVTHGNGVTIAAKRGPENADETGIGLICADGLWSPLRQRLGIRERPVFRQRTAWRALVPAADIPADLRTNSVWLWLGHGAHLVHYPVKAGALINIVAIVDDPFDKPGWSEPGERDEIVQRFSGWHWASRARDVVAVPQHWQKWALYDLPSLKSWGHGAATLLGDAAHPTLPFLAQGAAMAIEDAAVLAASIAQTPEDIPSAMRRYERTRRARTRRVQRGARRNSRVYHLTAAEALVRNFMLRTMGGNMLLRSYDWLYDWRPTPPR